MKAQSKALELVIVLFVLIVVAWVVINLFQSLIKEQTQKLENIQGEQELEAKVSEALSVCQQRCNNYIKSRSRKDLVEFCSERVSIDLNKDGQLGYTDKSKFPSISLGGVGVCEDAIPCFVLVECNAGDHVITAEDCKTAICEYFSENVKTSDEVRKLRLNEMLNPGKCYKATQIFHWYNLAFNATEELNCS